MSTRYNHIKYIGVLNDHNVLPKAEGIVFIKGLVGIIYKDGNRIYVTAAATCGELGYMAVENITDVDITSSNTTLELTSEHFSANIPIKSKPCGFEIVNYDKSDEFNIALFSELFAWAATQVDVRESFKMEAL